MESYQIFEYIQIMGSYQTFGSYPSMYHRWCEKLGAKINARFSQLSRSVSETRAQDLSFGTKVYGINQF